MATITATLSTKADGNGENEILLRVNISKNQRARVKSGIKVNPKRWNAVNGSIYAAKAIFEEKTDLLNKKSELDELKARIIKLCGLYDNEKEKLTSEWISTVCPLLSAYNATELSKNIVEMEIDKADNPDKYLKFSISELADKFLKARESQLSENTIIMYKSLFASLRRYEGYKRLIGGETSFYMDIDTMDKKGVEDFQTYLINEWELMKEYPEEYKTINAIAEQGLKKKHHLTNRDDNRRSLNGVSAYMLRFLTFLKWVMNEGFTNNNPLRKFKPIRQMYGTPNALTKDELSIIAHFDLAMNPDLELTRAAFVFQCMTGCRVSDLMALTENNIVGDQLQYIPIKTHGIKIETLKIRLYKAGIGIARKRINEAHGGGLFPLHNEHEYNVGIKALLKVCGIQRTVVQFDRTSGESIYKPLCEIATSHLARRTFIVIQFKEGNELNVIRTMSGHTEGSKALYRYVAVDEELRDNSTKALDI